MDDCFRTVYVVEDDPAVQQSVVIMLQTAGYEVLAFSSAEEFLRQPVPAGIVCLLVDVRLPGMNGDELIDWLIQNGRQPHATIVMSGHGEDETLSRVSHLARAYFCRKPHDPARLVEQVSEVFASYGRASPVEISNPKSVNAAEKQATWSIDAASAEPRRRNRGRL